MKNRYYHILQPLKIGNVVLKNRLLSSTSMPHFLQGPEKWPSEEVIKYTANTARNGAAVVTFSDWDSPGQRNMPAGDICRFPSYDFNDPSLDNYMVKMAEAVHCYDSKLSLAVMVRYPAGYGVSEVKPPEGGMPDMPDMFGAMGAPGGRDSRYPEKTEEAIDMGTDSHAPLMPCKEMGIEQMQQAIDELLAKLRRYKSFGFDGVSLHMAYGLSGAQFLSPLTNHRTDEFGGCLENRCRFPLMICQAIKDAFGKDFLVEVIMSGHEGPGGYTVEDTVGFAKLAEGKVDMIQIRESTGMLSHPTGFDSKPTPSTLAVAAAIKASGAKIVTVPIGGFQDPEIIENAITTGQTDMVGAARAFICDYDYGRKLIEGRGEDIIPCIRCNRCHGVHMDGPWIAACSVNPRLGLSGVFQSLEEKPSKLKKVAVIGGGISGMYSAIECAKRGHSVTLYEKSSYLGGQLRHAEYASFKWPLKRFRDYLVRQIDKNGVNVCLNTTATPDSIASMEYDAVIVAMGAVSAIPDIAGLKKADGSLNAGIWAAPEVFGREKELDENVVVIGGSEIGVETALYLAENGHKVTVLSRQKMLAYGAYRVHYYDPFQKLWENEPNLCYELEAKTTRVEGGVVSYIDKTGAERQLSAKSVVVCGGMNPEKDEALAFYGSAQQFISIGDCADVGNVQKCIRDAYTAALRI